MRVGEAVDDLEITGLRIVHGSIICGSLTISSISSSKLDSWDIAIGRKLWSIIGDRLIMGVGVTVPGRALSSEPGKSRSISLGDCPEKLGRDVVESSNKLLRLFVTESGSNRGRGNSRMYVDVLLNIGG